MTESITEMSTGEVVSLLEKPSVQIIDVRPVDAYNGWKLAGEQRGGHIPAARSIPLKWFNYIDWIEIVRKKEILPGTKLLFMAIIEKMLKVPLKDSWILDILILIYIQVFLQNGL